MSYIQCKSSVPHCLQGDIIIAPEKNFMTQRWTLPDNHASLHDIESCCGSPQEGNPLWSGISPSSFSTASNNGKGISAGPGSQRYA